MPLLRMPLSSLLPPLTSMALMTSIVALLSSTNWPTIWCFFELNMMLFILLMVFDQTKSKATAMTTYFLAQALGSSLFFLGALMLFLFAPTALSQQLTLLFITLGILVKTAAVPFHQWFIIMVSHLNWLSILVLSTFQKIAPFLLLTNILIIPNTTMTMTQVFLALSLLGGALGMMNASTLKTLMAFSSLHHLGWIISSLNVNNPFGAHTYIVLYLLSLAPLMILLHLLNISFFPGPFSQTHNNAPFIWLLVFFLLTLTGLPPLPLFFAKLAIISTITASSPIILPLMLFTTAVSSFSYLRFLFILMLTPTNPLKP